MNDADSKKLKEIQDKHSGHGCISYDQEGWLIYKAKEQDREIERLRKHNDALAEMYADMTGYQAYQRRHRKWALKKAHLQHFAWCCEHRAVLNRAEKAEAQYEQMINNDLSLNALAEKRLERAEADNRRLRSLPIVERRGGGEAMSDPAFIANCSGCEEAWRNGKWQGRRQGVEEIRDALCKNFRGDTDKSFYDCDYIVTVIKEIAEQALQHKEKE